jgi:hypothetical protein
MNIKLSATSLIILVLTFSQACKKKTAGPLNYVKTYEEYAFSVDTTNGTGNLTLGVFEVQTDILNELSAEGFSVNNLKSVKINEIKLEVLQAGQTLDYFRRIELKLSTSTAGNVIFGTKDLPENFENNFIVFSDEGVDLKEYFKQTEMIFTVGGINDLPIQPTPITLKISMKFDIQASLGN